MLGARIKTLRKKLKINQSTLAKNLGVKPSAVSQMESGGIKPSVDTLITLARICDVNLHWIITGFGPMFMEETKRERNPRKSCCRYAISSTASGTLTRNREEERASETIDIPVTGEIAAGPPVENFQGQIEFLTVRRGMVRGVLDDFVCLRVNGNSMEPSICHNDLVLIRQSQDWNKLSGQICALRIEGGITLKRLVMDDKEKMIILVPLNDEYKPMLINPEEHQDIKLLGSLFYLMRKVS